MSSLDRLRQWAENQDHPLSINTGTGADHLRYWSISAKVDSPVSFSAFASKPTVEEAATEVINQLQQVGEEVPGG